MPALAAIPAWVGTAASLIGTGVSAIGSYSQSQTMKSIYAYNSQVAAMQSKAAQISGQEQTRQLSEKKRKMIGSQIASYGGSGVSVGTGSPLDVIADTYASFERDIHTTGYNAEVSSRAAASQSAIDKWASERAGMAGTIGAGATLLGGVGKSLLQY